MAVDLAPVVVLLFAAVVVVASAAIVVAIAAVVVVAIVAVVAKVIPVLLDVPLFRVATIREKKFLVRIPSLNWNHLETKQNLDL